MIENWYAITFPQAKFPFAEAEPLLKFVDEIWERNNYPAGFSVFQEIDETYDKILYFSPTAWDYCREQVESGYDGRYCTKPINHPKPVVCMVGVYPGSQALLQ